MSGYRIAFVLAVAIPVVGLVALAWCKKLMLIRELLWGSL